MALLAPVVGSTRTVLETALKEAGFHYLEPAVLTRCVEEACEEVQLEEQWPWRIAEDAGAAPLAIALMGSVDSVRRSADEFPLYPRRHSELVERSEGGLDTEGRPHRYYVQGDTVRVHPSSVESITVRHFSNRVWTTGGERSGSAADTVAMPRRLEKIVLALARERAQIHNGDPDLAAQSRSWAEGMLGKARDQELVEGWDEPDVIRTTEAW